MNTNDKTKCTFFVKVVFIPELFSAGLFYHKYNRHLST